MAPKVLGLDLCLRGIAVENETANEREVFDICRDQVALCSVNRAILRERRNEVA